MVTTDEIKRGLGALGLDKRSHVLVHSSYRSFGDVQGGPATVVRALIETCATVMMPAFTWDRTLIWDAGGLFEGNAYRPDPPLNEDPQPFSHDTPIDKGIGVIAEAFRTSYPVRRSRHPLTSFIAHGALADYLVGPGTETDGVEPIRRLMEADGELLLLGVTHTASTAIHLAEYLAGRQLFIRHALTLAGATAVPVGGCSEAFDDLGPSVTNLERRTTVGSATLRCYTLRPYVEAARALIERDPCALLCDCDRCRAHRARVPA